MPEPVMASRLEDESFAKILKKVIKAGGKRGVEIEGAADMGGLQYFCTAVDEPEGDVDLLVEAMKAMNAESKPDEEERKGGSGKIGKTIVSISDDKFAIVSYVPEAKQDELTATEWLKYILAELDGATEADLHPDSDGVYAKAELKKDEAKGVFPMKLRDPAISHGITYLRSKSLFPEDEEDDDDEFVFGDDDFPSM